MFYLFLACMFVTLITSLILVMCLWNKKTHIKLVISALCAIFVTFFFVISPIFSKPLFTQTVTIKSENNGRVTLSDICAGNWYDGLEAPIDGCWKTIKLDNGEVIYTIDSLTLSLDTQYTDFLLFKVPDVSPIVLSFECGEDGGKALITGGSQVQEIDTYNSEPITTSIEIQSSSKKTIIDAILRIVITFVSSAIIFIGIIILLCSSLFKKLYVLCQKYSYEILLWLFSMLHIIISAVFPGIDEYTSTFYAMSYEPGFMSRGLLGSLVLLINPMVSADVLAKIKFILLIVGYSFFALIVGHVLKKADLDKRVKCLIASIYLLFPYFYVYIIDDLRQDYYFIILFIIALLLISKRKLMFIVPILCAGIILFNETSFVNAVFPVLLLLLYLWVKDHEKEVLYTLISSSVTSFVLTVFFALAGKGANIRFEDYYEHIKYHVDFAAPSEPVFNNYLSLRQIIDFMGDYFINDKLWHIDGLGLFLLETVPALFIFVMLMAVIYRKINFSSLKVKIIWIIMALSPLSSLGFCLITFDGPRYLATSFVVEFSLFLFLLIEEKLTVSVEDIYIFAETEKLKKADKIIKFYYVLLLIVSTLGFKVTYKAMTYKIINVLRGLK